MNEKWIEILKAGEYPQGNITKEMLTLVAQYYDPNFLQAAFIPEHRKFNENGELINNMSALGWIKAVKASNGSLYVLPEDPENSGLKFIYDGQSYRYASAEIQTEKINGKEVPYLGAVAVTNFPASRMDQIKFNNHGFVRVYTQKINIEDNAMNKDQFIQLCKVLGMPSDSKPEDVITKLTAKIKDLEKNAEFADTAKQLAEVVKLIKVAPEPSPQPKPDEAITQLTNTVNKLIAKFDKVDDDKVEAIFNQAVQDQKLLPSQKELMLKQFSKNPDGLKSFVDTLPKLQLSKDVAIPKGKDDKPLTYQQLLKDPAAYSKMQKDNPELVEQMRQGWLADPSVKPEDKK